MYVHGFADRLDSFDDALASCSARRCAINTAEVSLDNIVEEPRRKRAKFSSAILPLTPRSHSLRLQHLPTPAPTTISAISDEDVARTLISLGEISPPKLPLDDRDSFSLSDPLTESDKGSLYEAPVPAIEMPPPPPKLAARCARCKKSKKGCDRSRPCARCLSAGCADGCITDEDENTPKRQSGPGSRGGKRRGRGRGRRW
ncbi:putative transcriptional regulatory protein [Neolecta irregularis DAH-3]|uniref:Putative transcriptional regulatory protein n=1 Tax=Neolecta irregularis (strain DAH-3) TaxID=1198029 RepID=A0A1U7LKH5_NEOID|nr:putative transcriptional regulatory protein [Neolecta irregularis DAH-3]|eukprot:OLL23155.1 putative transcriptional regulatory protein [Neolecta irregularis DAH-3]